MTTFIGNISALQFLVSNGTPQRRAIGAAAQYRLAETRTKPRPCTVPDIERITELGRPDGIYTDKLHVNVADKDSRSQSALLASHVWTGSDRGTYLRIDNEYCVLTPEACFAQLAGELPLAQLVELGMMLCGTFAPAPNGLATRYDVEPLSTPKKIANYISRLKGKRGLDNARIAARILEDGAGSPMEAKIASSLALTACHGGMNAPAKLNVELKLTDQARGLGYNNVRRPDFLWPQHNIAMDYDSREYHDARERSEADEMRRNELSAMGLNSIVARPHHFRSQLAFETFMTQLFAAMPKSTSSTVRDLPAKRAIMFSQLFGAKQWRPMDVR